MRKDCENRKEKQENEKIQLKVKIRLTCANCCCLLRQIIGHHEETFQSSKIHIEIDGKMAEQRLTNLWHGVNRPTFNRQLKHPMTGQLAKLVTVTLRHSVTHSLRKSVRYSWLSNRVNRVIIITWTFSHFYFLPFSCDSNIFYFCYVYGKRNSHYSIRVYCEFCSIYEQLI